MRTTIVTVLLACCTGFAAAQDPTKAAPESYKIQFENAYIRVFRVHYAPHSRVPVHDHSRYPAGYVYLVDSGPVRFVHTGWDDPVLTRPATKAGSFRLSPTRFEGETHAVENNSDTASDFLRIEIMTEAPDRKSLVGRFNAFTGDRKRGLNKVEFENSQLRVTRLISKPAEALSIMADTSRPSLVVILSENNGDLGRTFWLQPNETKAFEKEQQVELLRFDFKTKPIKP